MITYKAIRNFGAFGNRDIRIPIKINDLIVVNNEPIFIFGTTQALAIFSLGWTEQVEISR